MGDMTSHGGEIAVGSDRIFINGRAAAKVGSFVASPQVVGTVPCVGGRILRH